MEADFAGNLRERMAAAVATVEECRRREAPVAAERARCAAALVVADTALAAVRAERMRAAELAEALGRLLSAVDGPPSSRPAVEVAPALVAPALVSEAPPPWVRMHVLPPAPPARAGPLVSRTAAFNVGPIDDWDAFFSTALPGLMGESWPPVRRAVDETISLVECGLCHQPVWLVDGRAGILTHPLGVTFEGLGEAHRAHAR